MTSIDLDPWRSVLQAGPGAEGAFLLVTHAGAEGDALRISPVTLDDAGEALNPQALPGFTLSGLADERRAGGVFCVVTDRCGCSLLALFSTAWEVLTDGGRLYLLRPGQLGAGGEPAPEREQRLHELAERCGFLHVERHDAADGSDRCLDEFSRREGMRWRVGHAGEHNREALQRLFRAVFEHEISPALWAWKYGQGRGCGTVVWHGDEVVAHYGVISRPIRLLGDDARGWLVGDVMVEVRERAALTKKGPFFLAAASCNDACLAFDRQHQVGAGFPNRRVMRLAERVGIYQGVGEIRELVWELPGKLPPPPRRIVSLTADAKPSLRRAVDRLWRRMDNDLAGAVLVRRDWDYLRHRYLQHPDIDYRVLLVWGRFGLALRGVVVLRPTDSAWELADVVGPLRFIPNLVTVAKRVAAAAGASRLGAWITSAHADHFGGTGCQVIDPQVTVPTSSWVPGPDPERIRDRWWLTYGDTDFH